MRSSEVKMQKKIALINDVTGFGRCSIAVMAPIVSAMKIQAVTVPTAILSAHTQFPEYYFDDYTPKMRDYIQTYKNLQLSFDAIATGFLGLFVMKGVDRFISENQHQDYQQYLELIEKINIAFIYAPLFHPVMCKVLPPESALGIKTIFYPDIPYEQHENKGSGNHYNCPIVCSYPEVIRNNVENLKEKEVRFLNPFMPLDNLDTVAKTLCDTFSYLGVTEYEAKEAVAAGAEEYANFKEDIRNKGKEMIDKCSSGIEIIKRTWDEVLTNGGFDSSHIKENNQEALEYLKNHSWKETQDKFFKLSLREWVRTFLYLYVGEKNIRRIKKLLGK